MKMDQTNKPDDPARAMAAPKNLADQFARIELRMPPGLASMVAAIDKAAAPMRTLAKRFDAAQRPLRELFAKINWETLAERTARARRLMFEETGNPLLAWEEYRISRNTPRPVPEWVLSYLDRAAAELHRLRCEDKLPTKLDAAHAAALGLKQPGKKGGGSIYEQEARFRRDCVLAESVSALVENGTKESEAWLQVAEQYRTSESTVRRAAKRYASLVSTY